jgi:hypothetical protein
VVAVGGWVGGGRWVGGGGRWVGWWVVAVGGGWVGGGCGDTMVRPEKKA